MRGSDGRGGNAIATVTVTVAPVEDPPALAPDEVRVAPDGTIVVSVLANDVDAVNQYAAVM